MTLRLLGRGEAGLVELYRALGAIWCWLSRMGISLPRDLEKGFSQSLELGRSNVIRNGTRSGLEQMQ